MILFFRVMITQFKNEGNNIYPFEFTPAAILKREFILFLL
jgi:hypothetical protein